MKIFLLLFCLLLFSSCAEEQQISESNETLSPDEEEILNNPFYENILDSGHRIPGRCELLGAIVCEDYRFTEEGLFLKISADNNYVVNNISIVSNDFSDTSCEAMHGEIIFSRDEIKIIPFDCFYVGEDFNADIFVDYVTAGGFARVNVGNIRHSALD